MDCGESQDYNFIIKLQYHYTYKCSLSTCMRTGSILEVLKLSFRMVIIWEKEGLSFDCECKEREDVVVFICR